MEENFTTEETRFILRSRDAIVPEDATRVLIAKNAIYIPRKSFEYSWNLEILGISGSGHTIEDYAFKNCQKITRIIFGSGLQAIHCFKDNKVATNGLVSLNIYFHSFEGCNNVRSLIFPKSMKEIDQCFLDQFASLQKVVMPKTASFVDAEPRPYWKGFKIQCY